MVNQGSELDRLFRALANETRRELVAGLSGGDRTVGELAGPLEMTPPAVSKHLRILEDAGVVRRTVAGRTHHISLEARSLEPAMAWLRNHGARWSSALDRLAARLDEEREAQA
jgi:DNA-binding transcriptional ArsR family regulator